jgi:4-amino-4-deoxy-L-arabinose transferase-like glycosyltransferase
MSQTRSRPTTRPAATVLPVVAAVAGWLLILLVSVGRIRDELEATLHRDEAIAWTYASLPLDDIPGALSYDVNPPVYFVALHTWLAGGGGGETFLRALSVLAVLAAAGVAFDAARRVADVRAGWLASIFVLLAPATLALAGLARPYALALLLGMVAIDAAIVMVQGGRVMPVVVLGVAGGLLPLTHYWGGLLLVAVLTGLAVTAWYTRRGDLITRALVATGIAFMAAVPWLSTLWVQLGSTPLAAHSHPTGQLLGETLTKAAGGQATAWVLGLLGAIAVGVALLRWRRTGQRPTVPASLRDPARVLLLAITAAAVLAVLALWLVSQVRPLFSPNYAFLVLAPVPVLVGVLASRRTWTFVVVLLALLAVSIPDVSRSSFADEPRESRGPEYDIARMLDYSTQSGDVIVTSPGRTLAVRYYLGPDRDYRTAIGGVTRGLFDYRDRVTRLRAADPVAVAAELADHPVGTRIAFVHDMGAPLPQRYWIELDRVMDRISWELSDNPRLDLVFNGELPDPYGSTRVDVYEVVKRP